MLLRRIFNFIRRHNDVVRYKIESFYVYIISKLVSIEIGENCRFLGVPYFSVSKSAKIIIGNNCEFRSISTSNLMGLNHKCILGCSSYNDKSGEIRIGDNCGFSGVSIWCVTKISIGNNVRVGANSLIMDHDAHLDDPRTPMPKNIVIDDNVFIGANCVIKKGVHIGKNSVIGMNSVVSKDIPSNCIAVGIPAKVIREL